MTKDDTDHASDIITDALGVHSVDPEVGEVALLQIAIMSMLLRGLSPAEIKERINAEYDFMIAGYAKMQENPQ